MRAVIKSVFSAAAVLSMVGAAPSARAHDAPTADPGSWQYLCQAQGPRALPAGCEEAPELTPERADALYNVQDASEGDASEITSFVRGTPVKSEPSPAIPRTQIPIPRPDPRSARGKEPSRAAEHAPKGARTGGRPTFPVLGHTKVVSKVGDPRANGRVHEGVDYAAARNTPIVAAWGGTVVKSGWDRLGGWRVRIRHPNGMATYYAHMNRSPSVHVGQEVAQGQRLGVVGESGDAQGTITHLHFEIRSPSGAVLNPLKYF